MRLSRFGCGGWAEAARRTGRDSSGWWSEWFSGARTTHIDTLCLIVVAVCAVILTVHFV